MQYTKHIKAIFLFGVVSAQTYAGTAYISVSSDDDHNHAISHTLSPSTDINTIEQNQETEQKPVLSATGGPLLKEVYVKDPADVSYDEIQSEIKALAEKSKDYVTPEQVRERDKWERYQQRLEVQVRNEKSSSTTLRLEDFTPVMPLDRSVITSNYGTRNFGGRSEFHAGIDFAAPTGTPIYSTGHGTVIFAGWRNGYGNFIEIDHGNGIKTRYGHASALFVRTGEKVSKRQRIAAVGSTGRSTGPHLHFEVFHKGVRQNPATYLAMLKNQ